MLTFWFRARQPDAHHLRGASNIQYKHKGVCMKFAFGLSLAMLMLASLLIAETKNAGGGSAAGKRIYAANCVTCHGPDGKGAPTGRAMGVKDLHSPAVVKMSDAQIKHVVANGKGNMPPWKSQLSEAQIAQVTAFVRSLQKTSAK
jgi:cytochrome c6